MANNKSPARTLFFWILLWGCAGSVLADDEVDAGNMDLNFSGQLINTSCTIIFPKDLLNLEAVSAGDFKSVGTTSTFKYQFQAAIDKCNLSPGVVKSIRLSFSTIDGQGRVPPGAFSNQLTGGAQGIGVAVYDQRDNQNVLNNVGESRVLAYPVTSGTPRTTMRDFYVKYMQTEANVTAGQVMATLVVSAFYE